MLFPDPPRRPSAENIIPMINVVFLLLIFFLMTAEIAPPEPFAVTPPDAQGQEPQDAGRVLYLGADGTVGFEGLAGEAALAALAVGLGGADTVTLRADAALPAEALAAMLARLAGLGIRQVELVTAR